MTLQICVCCQLPTNVLHNIRDTNATSTLGNHSKEFYSLQSVSYTFFSFSLRLFEIILQGKTGEVLISPFYRWGHWSSDRLSDLPKVTLEEETRREPWFSNSKSSNLSTSPVVTPTLSSLHLLYLHTHSQIIFNQFIFHFILPHEPNKSH